MENPFHKGEIAIQSKFGERERAILNGRLILDRIPLRAFDFVADQKIVYFGFADKTADLWVSMLVGRSPFLSCSVDGKNLLLKTGNCSINSQDLNALPNLSADEPIGLLMMDLQTRKRLRVNGHISSVTNGEINICVEEAFPNCPKYIQKREFNVGENGTDDTFFENGENITENIENWVTSADTFFVTSSNLEGGLDVSHRGGKPGFIKLNSGSMRIPDYPGNSMFGTLGNFHINPKAGLLFIDYTRNLLLQLTGAVRIERQSEKNIAVTGGTGRWWSFTPTKWKIKSLNTSVVWGEAEYSPFHP